MFGTTYNFSSNNNSYHVKSYFYVLNDDGDIDMKSWLRIIPLDMDNLNKFKFTSDILQPYQMATMIYEDKGNFVCNNLIANGRLFMKMYIEEGSTTSNITETQKMEIDYVVINIKNVATETASSTYNIDLINVNWLVLNNNYNYSSRGELGYLTIIEKMMVNCNLNVKKLSNINGKKGHYITPNNFTLLQSIYKCLAKSIDKDVGLSFVCYDHINNQFDIKNIKYIYNNLEKFSDYGNIFGVPTGEDMSSISEGTGVANNVVIKNELGFQDYYNNFKDMEIKKYSYDKRSWNTEPYMLESGLTKVFPTLDEDAKIQFKNSSGYITKGRNTINYECEHSNLFFDKMKNLLLYSNVMQFSTFGILRRKAGDVVLMNISLDNKLYKKLSGLWFINRIEHNFTHNEGYHNIIHVSRLHEGLNNV